MINLTSIKIHNIEAYAEYKKNGVLEKINLLDGSYSEKVKNSTVFGSCEYFFTTVEKNGIIASLMFNLDNENNFIIVKAKISNQTGEDVYLKNFILLKGNPDYPEKSLVTPLLSTARSFEITKSDFSKTWIDAIGIFPPIGEGLLIGPVGEGIAYVNININANNLQIISQMDNILLENGESRESEEIIILCGESEICVPLWAGECGKKLNARTKRESLDGWCSWYDRTTNITEEHVNNILETFSNNKDIFNPMLVQIDDGYQLFDGDWSANKKFPSGMKKVAENIKKNGYMAGKWLAPLMICPELDGIDKLMPSFQHKDETGNFEYCNANPFHPLGGYWFDPTHPISKEYLQNIIKQSVDDGYDYIKIDFNNIGSIFFDKKKTTLQVFRELYDLYRKSATEGMYILSCIASPTRGAAGYCDSARIGPDSHPGGIYDSLEHTLKYQYIHKKWWNNDPDVSYIATIQQGRYLGETGGGIDLLRTWHSAIGISGGAAMTSEPLQEEIAKENWRMIEIMTPPTKDVALLYDLCRSDSMARFGFTAHRSYGDFATVLLWNESKEESLKQKIDAETLFLSCKKMVVYSFWDNEINGIFENTYLSKELKPMQCEHLCITPLNYDFQVVGSNLHLSCGAEEIDNVISTKLFAKIHLTQAGAKDGSLFVYSKNMIFKISSKGLDASLEKLENGFYKIEIKNRIKTSNQIIKLFITT